MESVTRRTIIYESSFTVIEYMLQSLASIASMCSYVNRNSGKLVPTKPKVVFVGTHKDQASENHIRKIQRELRETFKDTEYFNEGVIVFASLDEPALTVNSLAANDEDISKIRLFIERLASDPAFKVSVPAPWLALMLSLRQVESPVISYEDCQNIASDCSIYGDEELQEALWFLHTKLGVLRYFHQIPELKEIVICDPQIIFNKINNLITQSFSFERTQDACMTERFLKEGIFPANVIDEISLPHDHLLTSSRIAILLKHMNIIAPIYDSHGKVTHYFMACALAHADKSQPNVGQSPIMHKLRNLFHVNTGTSSSKCYIPTLCVSFRCGYCPKGVFSALVVDLMKPTCRKLQWRLVKEAIFRDQVSFEVGREHHIVKIIFLITHLEVVIMATTEAAQLQQQSATKAKKLCNSIRHELKQSLIAVSKTLHYGSGAGTVFGFYCPCSSTNPATCDEEDPIVIRCKKCGPIDLDERHRVWFGESLVIKVACLTCQPCTFDYINVCMQGLNARGSHCSHYHGAVGLSGELLLSIQSSECTDRLSLNHAVAHTLAIVKPSSCIFFYYISVSYTHLTLPTNREV